MSEKLKLLEAIDSYLPHVDGVINCMHNYCTNACKTEDVVAAAPRYKKHTDDLPYKIVRCNSIYVPGLNIQYGLATNDKKFWQQVTETQYDIVHVHSPFNMAKFALKVAKKQNIPAVITYHTNMRPIFRSVVKSKKVTEVFMRRFGKLYNKFDEVFLCSPLVEKQLRTYGYTGKVFYLPFGTNRPKCDNKEELRDYADKALGLSRDELVFIYVGRLEQLKRIDFTLDSLKILKDRGLSFKFFVSGTGGALKKLTKRVSKLGLDEEVKFLGFLDDEQLFNALYARGDMLLFPSLYDNFGLVKVEAAAFDTPGLYIQNSCAGYGVTDGVNGYLAQDNPVAFANRIQKAVADRDELKKVGKQAGVDLYVTWEECTNQFVARLKQIVKERKDDDTK
ncbi:MAG: glycosyltransferase [Corallococcus sp.]|nr:glycosyltransferase [Corallococcus sp.]MCM1359598.1 glycosyltransferase [Corallococcus sp.]MCM1395190.1 glycosyltransferase [Corallococcus sp.]